MRKALSLARRMLGRTSPNPAVGCVIVRGARIVGQGATAEGGRPHAEAVALARAGARARGATAYVSFEPCADRKSTRLNSSHPSISYAVFCLKKKKKTR